MKVVQKESIMVIFDYEDLENLVRGQLYKIGFDDHFWRKEYFWDTNGEFRVKIINVEVEVETMEVP